MVSLNVEPKTKLILNLKVEWWTSEAGRGQKSMSKDLGKVINVF